MSKGCYLMPTSPARMCLDCSSRAIADTKYCEAHRTQNRATAYKLLSSRYRNDDPIRKLYQCKRWTRGVRLRVLRRDPLCCICGCRASTTVDHHPLTAREILEQFNVSEFYALDRLRGLCASCHSTKEAKETGFAKPRIPVPQPSVLDQSQTRAGSDLPSH
jgi:5-methylcytosine-specific restriction endonuclease McrA